MSENMTEPDEMIIELRQERWIGSLAAMAAAALGAASGVARLAGLPASFPTKAAKRKPRPTLHPTKGWRGPGTASRGTNRRRRRVS